MFDEFVSKRDDYQLILRGEFTKLMVFFKRFNKNTYPGKYIRKNDELINKMRDYINTKFREKKYLQELSDRVGLNRSYFSSLFKKSTGFGVVEYINELRIHYSIELLKTTAKSILEISLLAGFDSLSLFYSAFKKSTSISPHVFRKNIKNLKF